MAKKTSRAQTKSQAQPAPIHTAAQHDEARILELASYAAKRVVADDAEAIATELELLVKDVATEQTTAAEVRMSAAMSKVGGQIDRFIRDAVARQGHERTEPYQKGETYAFGDRVAYKGGVWRCAARNGAKPTDEPSAASGIWVLEVNGVDALHLDVKSIDKAVLTVSLSNGTEAELPIDLPAPNPRGTWRADNTYHKLDVVTLNGGSFIARRDAPGPCPGDGWQLLAARGKTGSATQAKLKQMKDDLEHRSNARSIEERVRGTIRFRMAQIRAEFEGAANNETDYEAFATKLAGDICNASLIEMTGPIEIDQMKAAMPHLMMAQFLFKSALIEQYRVVRTAHDEKDRPISWADGTKMIEKFEARTLDYFATAIPILAGDPNLRRAARGYAEDIDVANETKTPFDFENELPNSLRYFRPTDFAEGYVAGMAAPISALVGALALAAEAAKMEKAA